MPSVMAAARAHAVDVILRDVIGHDPWPLNNGVVLVDEPADERIALRYFNGGKVYVLYSSRLVFAELNGRIVVSPCPPRRAPAPAPPGVWYSVPASHLSLDWRIAGDPPPPRRRWGPR